MHILHLPNKLTLNFSPSKKYSLLFWVVLSAFLISISFSQPSYSHRSPADEIDNCRIKDGFVKIHFTAYTPRLGEFKQTTDLFKFTLTYAKFCRFNECLLSDDWIFSAT